MSIKCNQARKRTKSRIEFFQKSETEMTKIRIMCFDTGYNMGFNEGRKQERRLNDGE